MSRIKLCDSLSYKKNCNRLALYNKFISNELQVVLNFYWKLFEWIMDRYERTIIGFI